MHDVHMAKRFEKFAREVRDGAAARRRVIERARFGARERKQFAHVAHRQGRMDHEDVGDGNCLRHRRKIAEAVVAAVRIQAHRDGESADGAEQQRIAVRRRFGDLFSAGHAAGARAIVDDDGLAQRFVEFLAYGAADDVGRPAGGKRHDHTHGLRGERLSAC